MRIGIFGGTFDPPHIGHLILAAEALEQLSLDSILWILTPFPPHKQKQKITPIMHRQRMVELAINGNNCFVLSRIDMDRVPPHYAVDTLILLHEQMPEDELYYLMGADSLNDIPKWHRPIDFVNLCTGIVVMSRSVDDFTISVLKMKKSGLRKKLHYLKTPNIDISGTDIRSRIKNGRQYRYFIPERVYQYIVENQLYKH
jgi:nicotinate-nucleotide adenylyltransferase